MRRLLPLVLLAACQGGVGTIDIDIVTAPDSTVMDDVQRLRLTLTSPEKVVEAERVGDRFDISIEVTAGGQNGSVILEGFDAGGDLVASGRSAPLPIAAIDAEVAIYVAAPVSVAEAPVRLPAAYRDMGATRLSFGLLLAGGRDADGAATDDLVIYNVYDHAFQVGEPLPAARAGVSAMTASAGQVLIFGGDNSAGDPTATLYRFDTNAAPAGLYYELASDGNLARSGARAVPIGDDIFMVLGDPLVFIDGLGGGAEAFANTDPLDGEAISVLLSGLPHTLITGDGAGVSGATILANGAFTTLDSAPPEVDRTGHGMALLADGDAVVIGGQTAGGLERSAVRFDFLSREFTVIDDLLATARNDAAVTAAGGYLIVAGGTADDGTVLGDAEIFSTADLSPVAVVPLVIARTGATALRLPNDQIAIVDGTDADGNPTDRVELFTP